MADNMGLNPIAYRGERGGFLAHAIRLAARTLEHFHLESPKFFTSLLCFLNTLWQNFKQNDVPGRLLQSFMKQEVMKKGDRTIFILFKMAEIFRGLGTICGQENNCSP